MAEEDTVERLRGSLARRRLRADQVVAIADEPMRLPTAAEIARARPVQVVLAHPLGIGLVAGTIFLIGPMRLLRIAIAALGIVHTALSVTTAYRALGARHVPDRIE